MHEEEFNIQIVYSPEVIEFVKLCNAYCLLLENLAERGPDEFVERSLALLSGIYSRVISLERPDPLYSEGNEKFVTEQDWSGVYQGIARLLGPYNQYLRIVKEDDYDRSDLVTHTISEDMSDIYQDLRDFTELYSSGLEDFMNDALWEVLENFEEHWGEKTLNALSALHQLYIKDIDFDGQKDGSWDPGQDPTLYDNSMFNKFRDQLGEED